MCFLSHTVTEGNSFAVGSSVLARIMICFDGHANVPASAIEWVGQYLLSYG
jgi:hypothetical protein